MSFVSEPHSVPVQCFNASSRHVEMRGRWRLISVGNILTFAKHLEETSRLWLRADEHCPPVYLPFQRSTLLLKRGWRVLTRDVYLNSTLLPKCTLLTVYKSESSLSHACHYCSKVQKCKSQVLLHPPPTPDRSAPRRSSFKLTSTNTVASGSAACTRRITKSHSSPVHVNETLAPLSSSKALLSADSYHFTSGLWAGHGRTRLQQGWRIINSLLSLSLGHTAHLFQTRARLLMPH